MHKTTYMSDIIKSPTCFGMLQVPSSASLLSSGLRDYDIYGTQKHVGDLLTFLYVCCALPVLDLTDQLYYLQSKSIFLGDFLLWIYCLSSQYCQGCVCSRPALFTGLCVMVLPIRRRIQCPPLCIEVRFSHWTKFCCSHFALCLSLSFHQ